MVTINGMKIIFSLICIFIVSSLFARSPYWTWNCCGTIIEIREKQDGTKYKHKRKCNYRFRILDHHLNNRIYDGRCCPKCKMKIFDSWRYSGATLHW